MENGDPILMKVRRSQGLAELTNLSIAKLLFTLGLNRYPPIDALLKIAAGRAPLSQRALEYLLSNHQNHYPTFKSDAYPDIAFIPAINTKGINILAKPGEVFTNPECAMLGFAVAQPYVASPENAAKLGIQKDPPLEQLVIALINNVTVSVGAARKIFEVSWQNNPIFHCLILR